MFPYADKWTQGLPYNDFLERYATGEQKRRWGAVHEQVRLTDAQRTTLGEFTRDMPVMVLAGAWCGDCIQQCPIFDHFAAASPRLQVRYFDRDDHPDLGDELQICGGKRVPTVLWLSEDFTPCGRYGDRTLSRYRQIAAEVTGAACPTGLVLPGGSALGEVTQEWLNEFERIHFILRTSGRLRQKHGD